MVEEANALKGAARAIVQKWLNQSLTRGFGAWVDMWEIRYEALRKLKRAASKIINRRLAQGFAGWYDVYESLKRGDATATAVQRAGKRLMNRGLSRGFSGWVAMWEEAVSKQAKMRGVLSRWLNQQMSRGFSGWARWWRNEQQAASRAQQTALSVAEWQINVLRGELGSSERKYTRALKFIEQLKVAMQANAGRNALLEAEAKRLAAPVPLWQKMGAGGDPTREKAAIPRMRPEDLQATNKFGLRSSKPPPSPAKSSRRSSTGSNGAAAAPSRRSSLG